VKSLKKHAPVVRQIRQKVTPYYIMATSFPDKFSKMKFKEFIKSIKFSLRRNLFKIKKVFKPFRFVKVNKIERLKSTLKSITNKDIIMMKKQPIYLQQRKGIRSKELNQINNQFQQITEIKQIKENEQYEKMKQFEQFEQIKQFKELLKQNKKQTTNTPKLLNSNSKITSTNNSTQPNQLPNEINFEILIKVDNLDSNINNLDNSFFNSNKRLKLRKKKKLFEVTKVNKFEKIAKITKTKVPKLLTTKLQLRIINDLGKLNLGHLELNNLYNLFNINNKSNLKGYKVLRRAFKKLKGLYKAFDSSGEAGNQHLFNRIRNNIKHITSENFKENTVIFGPSSKNKLSRYGVDFLDDRIDNHTFESETRCE